MSVRHPILAPLMSFDKEALLKDSPDDHGLGGFIMGLALVYNDFHDLMGAVSILETTRPPDVQFVSAATGEYCGRSLHLLRAIISLLHELISYIDKNRRVIDGNGFQDILMRMSPADRKQWASLANAYTYGDGLEQIFAKFRNKVSFHYDSDELYKGFKKHCAANSSEFNDRCYLSRGRSLEETRFYFADAAAQGYLIHILGGMSVEEFLRRVKELFPRLCQAIFNLVDRYVQTRGFTYRSES